MRKLTPQRRRATVLAACAAILATLPVLLLNGLQGRGRDFNVGICVGLSITLSLAALILVKRNRSQCSGDRA